MYLETKISGFERAIAKLTKYYDQIITSNEDTAKYARELILKRVSTGKTTTGKQMKYAPKADKKGRLRLGSGDYSYSHAHARGKKSLGTVPMTLSFDGGLYKSFAYRRSRTADTISLRFYFKNTQTKSGYSHGELAEDFKDRFNDNIFYPSISEVQQIKKYYKNNFRQ